MVECLYSIMDTKQSYYGSLMTFRNDATAIRAFMEMLISNEPNSMLHLYPTDYSLFCLGTFDKEKGIIESHIPQLVITGFDCVVKAVDEVQRREKMQKLFAGGVEPQRAATPDVDTIKSSLDYEEQNEFDGVVQA